MLTLQQYKAETIKVQEQHQLNLESKQERLNQQRQQSLASVFDKTLTRLAKEFNIDPAELREHCRPEAISYFAAAGDEIEIQKFSLIWELPGHASIRLTIRIYQDERDNPASLEYSRFVVDNKTEYYQFGLALVAAEEAYRKQPQYEEKEEELKKPALIQQAVEAYYDGDFNIAQTAALISIAGSLKEMYKHGLPTYNAHEV